MLAKQNDPIMKKQKFNTTPIDYNKLNKLAEDIRKRFVPQMQLSAEQAFWLPLSNPKSEQLEIIQTAVEIEIPKELSKISLILKNGPHNELNGVKMVFNQMKADVEQCSVDKKYYDIQKKEVSLDNDRLLDHIICQDVMNIVLHADYVLAKVLPADNKCLVNDNLEIERLEQENDHLFKLLLSQGIVHICVNSLASRNDCREMQQGFIDEYNENLMLKAELAKRDKWLKR
nr:hypothetical protein [Tanacetum cinerariifolium]